MLARVLGVARSRVQGPSFLLLSARAVAAPTAPVGGFSLLGVLVYIANEHPAIYTGTRTLQASVVSLYSVVVLLSGWVRLGCARLCGVHRGPFPLGRVPGSCASRGAIRAIPLSNALIIPV